MENTLNEYLHQLEFGVDDYASSWHPLGRGEPIVIDPKVAFGAPVIRGTRIRTHAIFDDYSGPQSVGDLAWTYGIEEWEVEAAVRFEQQLSAA